MRIHVKTCAFLAMSAATLFACGGKTPLDGGTTGDDGSTYPDGGAAEAAIFVGTWNCVGGITWTPASTGGGPSSTQSNTDLATFVANADGTLALTLEALTINSTPVDTDAGDRLSFTFSALGSTATATSSPVWSSDGAIFTFKTGTFVVSGSAGKLDLNSDVSGQGVQPGTDATVMSCTRGEVPGVIRK